MTMTPEQLREEAGKFESMGWLECGAVYRAHADALDRIAELEAKLLTAQMKIKRYEPVNTYDGLDIEKWKARAEKAEAEVARLKDDEAEFIRVVADVGVEFVVDGDSICARFGDFTNLQESPAGFGYSNREALVNLLDAYRRDYPKE